MRRHKNWFSRHGESFRSVLYYLREYRGYSVTEIADFFQVSTSTAHRWLEIYDMDGSLRTEPLRASVKA